MRAHLLTLAATLAFTMAQGASAQSAKPMSDMKGMSMPASATKTGRGTGAITEIDQNTGTVTIRRQPIASLGWPAMTMGFRATPPKLLSGFKVGEKVSFEARQGSGVPEVTAIRKR
jgi:Cu(I)/Ag(I) efflux system periplasmic protein CusF